MPHSKLLDFCLGEEEGRKEGGCSQAPHDVRQKLRRRLPGQAREKSTDERQASTPTMAEGFVDIYIWLGKEQAHTCLLPLTTIPIQHLVL